MHSTFLVEADKVQWGVGKPTNCPVTRMSNSSCDPSQGSTMSRRILCVFRVSQQTSTTENQRLGMEEHICAMPVKPHELHITASNWRKPIPEMTQLMLDIHEKKWDEIHFWSVCRAGRNHHYDVNLWESAKDNDVLLRFIADDLRSDRQGDDEKFYDESITAFKERRRISERTKRGIARVRRQRALRGEPDPFHGRKKGDLWVRTRKAIPTILALLRAGFSVLRISKDLKMDRRTITQVKNAPIEKLRELTKNPKLEPWKD